MPYVPQSWLAEHVEVKAGTSAADLAKALVSVGLEEEEIHPPKVTGPLVVGKVLTMTAETHKNGKTINYCRVDVGEYNDQPGEGKEPSELASRGIVCGAHNFKVGDSVVVSLPGTVLPGEFKIAARKTYGHISDGMICSDRELGLGEDHDGIIVLNERFDQVPAPGSDAIALLGLGEELLEINVTPDRGYCFSMRGIAREYHHATGAKFTDPASEITAPTPSDDAFSVTINDQAPIHGKVGCTRFATRIVRGVDPTAPTPKWMAERLTAAGMRPISIVVDITNYVMLDLGQPLHAYDLDKLVGGIEVRRAKAGETITTLDDVKRTCDGEDLLITDSDGTRPLGFAGVMGAANTEVSETTTAVLIEAAHFDPVSVARTARRHRLPSEAAKRFERGVDPKLPPLAAQACVSLLEKYANGKADTPVGDIDNTQAPQPVDFAASDVKNLAGIDLPAAEIARILTDIGCEVAGDGEHWQVTAPSWRPDLGEACTFVEEVARIAGYDQIPSILPRAQVTSNENVSQIRRRIIARMLAEHGLEEVLSFPFTSADRLARVQGSDDVRALKLANPLADDAPYLRTHLLATLLDTAVRNRARGAERIAVMELGMVVIPKAEQQTPLPAVGKRPSQADLDAIAAVVPHQPWHVAAVLSGPVTPGSALGAPRAYDWADAIELAQLVADSVGAKLAVNAAQIPPFHPGRCAEFTIGDQVVGVGGELHPRQLEALELPARTVAFELNLDALFAAVDPQPHAVAHVSTFPMAKEDFAFVVADDVRAASVLAVVKEAAGALCEDVRIFDIYRGAGIAPGHYSIAVAVKLRADDATLSAEDIHRVRNAVIKAAEKQLGAQLRS